MMRRCVATGAAFLAIGTAVALGSPGDAVFTIANYPVDAVAADAVRAKDKAMAEGQVAAFRSLLKRIVPVTAYDRLKRVSAAKAAELVSGVSVRTERNSTTQYIAGLDFAFDPQGVRDLLKRSGVPFIDQQAARIGLVPVTINPDQPAELPVLQSNGAWGDAWAGLDLDHTLTPLKLETARPPLTPGMVKQIMDGGEAARNAVRALGVEYHNDHVVIALAEIDRATGKVMVTLAGTDAAGDLRLKRGYRLGQDHAYAMELAAVVGLGVIEGRWKAVQAGARGGVDVIAGGGQTVRLEAEFSSLTEWNDMRRRLLETAGVDGLSIDGISARTADLSLRFPGGAAQLAETLAPAGLSLRKAGEQWVLRSSF